MSIKNLPKEELLLPGHGACAGCGSALALRYTLKALGSRTIIVIPANCTSVIQSPYPTSAIRVPVLNIAFAAAASAASGVAAGLQVLGEKDITVLAWAGDGGTVDIGIQALSGAAERDTNFIYACYDNEAYMNTGRQRSGATPYGALTTTTPEGKKQHKKEMPLVMASHQVSYVATACSAYPIDLYEKMKKAKTLPETKYIHILTPCPSGWLFDSRKTVEMGRLAVETGYWPLYEIENSEFRLTAPSAGLIDSDKRKPIELFLRPQGRFKQLGEHQILEYKKRINAEWRFLSKLSEIIRSYAK